MLEPRVFLNATDVALSTATEDLDPVAGAVIVDSQALASDPVSQSHGRHIWMWEKRHFNALLDDIDQRDATLDFLEHKGVNTVYLYARAFNGDTTQYPIVNRPDDVGALLTEMHARGFTVYALLDETDTVAANQAGSMFREAVDAVFDYNSNRPASERFDGMNLDIEPWILDGWGLDTNKTERLTAYLELSQDLVTQRNSQPDSQTFPFELGPAIPVWFHGPDDQTSFDYDAITWSGQTQPMHQHLQDLFDYVTVMDYRDIAGPEGNSIIAQAQDEIDYANSIGGKRVVIALEVTSDVIDPQTFIEEGEVWMESQLSKVASHFARDTSFDGFAIQDFDGYYGSLSLPATLPPWAGVVDAGSTVDLDPDEQLHEVDNDRGGVAIVGTWVSESSGNPFNNSSLINDGSNASDSVIYTPHISGPGRFRVYTHIPSELAGDDLATNVPIEIVHANGTAAIELDQRAATDDWVFLGEFEFAPTAPRHLMIGVDGVDGSVVADAVWFEFIEAVDGPPISDLLAIDAAGVLHDIDRIAGAAVNPRVTGIDDPIGITQGLNGLLYALTGPGETTGVPNALYTINPFTGESTLIGDVGLGNINEGDLDEDPTSGILYGLDNAGGDAFLFTIDPSTGMLASPIGSINLPGASDFSAIAFADDGTLYLLRSNDEAITLGDPNPILADSSAEFSDEQGQDGWEYGYLDQTSGGSFELLPHFNTVNARWEPEIGTAFATRIGARVMHPNGPMNDGQLTDEHWATRRWTSDVDGRVDIELTMQKLEAVLFPGIDGVEVKVLVDGDEIFSRDISPNLNPLPGETTWPALERVVLSQIEVQNGTALDFVVAPKSNHGRDFTNLEVVITPSPSVLYEIDKTNATIISSLPLDTALGTTAGMDFDEATGALYIVDGLTSPNGTDSLYTVDLATGALTPIGITGIGLGQATGLEFVSFDDNPGTDSPVVTGLWVNGTAWEQSFRDVLDPSDGLGAPITAGGSDQLIPLPWVNLDQVIVRFDKDTDVVQEDLDVAGEQVSNFPTIDFVYDASTFTATWTLSTHLSSDSLTLTLSDRVNADGVALDGGDFVFNLNVLPGDVTGDDAVDADDIDAIAAAIRAGSAADQRLDLNGDGVLSLGTDTTTLVEVILGTRFGDINLDQRVSVGDLSLLSSNFGSDIATGDSVGWRQGDMNGDGRVSIGDLSILSAEFGFDAAEPIGLTEDVTIDSNQTQAEAPNSSVPDPAQHEAATEDDGLDEPYAEARGNRQIRQARKAAQSDRLITRRNVAKLELEPWQPRRRLCQLHRTDRDDGVQVRELTRIQSLVLPPELRGLDRV